MVVPVLCTTAFMYHRMWFLSLPAAGERQWGYGVVVSVLRKSPQDRVGVPESAAAAYLVDTLLCVAGTSGDHKLEQERKREAQGAPAPAALTAANAEMQVGTCGSFLVLLTG